MAVKRYDGSAWQTVAGLGAQGAAATSSSIATWVKTASGGETSLSGNDDNSQPLSYTIGQELVFINGTLLKRGSDYTATNGTSITGLTALAANDVATVWTVNAFSVTNAISSGLVTTTGDIIYASAANTPARLGIGSTGQVLKVSGGVPAWGSDASGKVLQVVSAVYSTSTGITTTSYADTGLTATITPTLNTSKILVLISQHITLSGGAVSGGAVKILRGSTDIYTVAGTNNQAFLAGETAANSYLGGSFAFNYLDSPATTSATTYKTQGRRNSNASSVMTFNGDGASSSITLLEIGA